MTAPNEATLAARPDEYYEDWISGRRYPRMEPLSRRRRRKEEEKKEEEVRTAA